MRTIILLAGLSLSLTMAGSPIWAAGKPQAETAATIPRSTTWEMQSDNGRRFKIYAAWPDKPAPPEGFPVIYTMDADMMFDTFVDGVRLMEMRPDAGLSAIVIGVGYPAGADVRTERVKDLSGSVASSPAPGTGGAEDLMAFIERRLKPEVMRRFPIDQKRESLFGHSLGGHFVLYTLINHPELFDNYIAASPSIWYADRLLASPNLRKRLGPKLQQTGATPRVLITVGEYEQKPDPDFPRPANSDQRNRGQVDDAKEYAAFLSQQPGMSADFSLLPGEDHSSAVQPAISRALRFIFRPSGSAITPAPRQTFPAMPIPVPTATGYTAMTADQRYALRLKVRALPEVERLAWTEAFDWSLGAGLTYRENRLLAEERVAMDKAHGTQPPSRH